MKKFFKQLGVTVLGLSLTIILFSILGIVALCGIAAAADSPTEVADGSILQVELNGEATERDMGNPISKLINGEQQGLVMDKTLEALRGAATDDKIKGVYLKCGDIYAAPAMLEELRQALVDFKKSGKWVIAYGDAYSKRSYYVASCSNQILMNPDGALEFKGFGGNQIYFKDFFDKAGIKVQVFKVGTFKSAVEPFIRTDMSPADREQTMSYLNSIWNNVLKDVAASRKMQSAKLNEIADTLVGAEASEVSVQVGLVDKLCYIDEVKSILRNKMGMKDDNDDKLCLVSVDDYVRSLEAETSGDQIAVYYAEGEISDEVPTAIDALKGASYIVGDEMVNDLQKLREDDDVKAVVIRVNSPGGSAYASEQIWREISLLKAKKPVVISMGDYAASGGYYISCNGSRIFADRTTLTGSIGIYGMIPEGSELLNEKIGLKFDTVKTNKMSDFGGGNIMGLVTTRPYTPAESAKMQNMVNRGYEQFTKRVADGRKMSVAKVKAIAEGRVWTGEQAKKIGLVDELGNLQQAIACAAKLAKVEKYHTTAYPEEENILTQMFDNQRKSYLDEQLHETLGVYYTPFMMMKRVQTMSPIQARMPYELNIQ